jgi:DNA ligase-1
MDYRELVKYYEELESTSKKLIKTDILAKLFKESPLEDLDLIVYLVQGKVFPEWDEKNIGFSSRLVLKAISTVIGVSSDEVEKLWKKKGDLGTVVEELVKTKKQTTLVSKKLSTEKVFENIRKLAELEGEGTVNKKVQLVAELLSNASPKEAKFIVRTVLEDLRVGVKEGIIRDAISKAFEKDVKEVEDAFNLTVDYGEVAKLAKKNKLKDIEIKVGRPAKLMLSVIVNKIEEAFEALGETIQAEYKMDGFRIQAHKDNDKIKLFTRRMEEVTKQFPDIVEFVKKNIKGEKFIIDCEAVGLDKKTGKYLPFQSVSQRIKRKYDIEKTAKEFPVELNVFDILYLDGKNLMNLSLIERRKILEKIVKEKNGEVALTKKLVSNNLKEITSFYKESLEAGNEGLMLKNINSNYIPGRYVNGWGKIKNVLEPLDLVIVGATYGEGKRAGDLSSFIVACKNKDKFLECGMVSTGIKEKENEKEDMTYKEMTKLLQPLIIKEEGRTVFVKPKIIIEVGYEEIQKSPTYGSGFALRFPRFMRLRTDKPLNEINSIEDLEKIYKYQKGKNIA